MGDTQNTEHKKDDSAKESQIKTENSAASDEVKRSIFAAFGASSVSAENPFSDFHKNAAGISPGRSLH